ncbi:MAG: ABC transporter substrate-binding protein [Planctomycetes bacterium]|nr:ABC transporter substrate-binding protein [Planctomycetota bacterium]
MRVATLLPSATEIVCALGARAELVGVSHECDYPVGVEKLPVLTRTRRTLPRASGAIDAAVRDILRDALTVYEVDTAALREAAPELIVTQDLCEVCAVSIDDVRTALRELARADVELLSLSPLRLADVWGDILRVARALGREEQGRSLVQSLEARIEAIRARAATLDTRPRVLTIEWLDPVMIGGTWMPELVELAGGEALVTRPGDHAPTLDLEQLAALDPEIVLIKPCGFSLERTSSELELLRTQLPWSSWSAARAGRVFVADGNAFFNRPGPRLVESLEITAACVHPLEFAALARKHARNVRRVGTDLVLAPAF